MPTNVAKGGAFEQEVERLLRLKGYVVTRNELINGTQIDLVARKNDLLDNLCFVVECTDRDVTVGVDLVKQKAAVLLSLRDSRYLFRLIFVARNGFTAEAKAYADSQPNVLLLTPSDLESQLIDFGPYSNWYVYNYENSSGFFKEGKLYNNYVELIAKDEKEKTLSSLTQEVRRWLREDSNNLLFLLGEYGSGKTSFCRHLVYQLLTEKYQNKSKQDYIPLLINLREHRSGAPNLQQVITDTLINQYGVQLPSFLAFEHVCSSGRILLVLDGFDEMAEKSDKQTLIDSFNQIYLLASLNAKIILTCRSNFFHSHTDVIDLLKHFSINIPLSEEVNPKIVQLTFEHHGRLLYVEKLNDAQIREFISNRFGAQAEAIYAQINSIHDLSDLSTRPVLLDMILTTLPELSKSDRKINSAALYQFYTDKWTARDDWRVKIPLAVRQSFSEILGWVMHNMRVQEIEFPVLERIMIRSVEPLAQSEDQLETFKNDIQTCSFLVRIGRKDQFRFAHKSFQEFFVARKIISDISKGITLKQPETEELIEAKKHTDTFELSVDDIFISHGIFWRPSNFDSIYKTLGKRLRSSAGYVTIYNSDVSASWPALRSENAVKSHLEEQIREVLSKRGISDKSTTFGISPEISTFAIEYLENTGITLQDFISKLEDKESLTIFCDILRLNQSTNIIKDNSDYLRRYVKDGKEELLKISFCAALSKVPSSIDYDFVNEVRNSLSDEGWSYFLFELASQGQTYKDIIQRFYDLDNLSTIDKLICVHGLRGSLSDAESDLVSESLVVELLNSSIEQEKLLGITLCQSVMIPVNTLANLMLKMAGESQSTQIKIEAISILSSLEGKQIWQALRGLLLRETDEGVKALLKQAEQRVRTATSQQGNKINWNQGKRNYAVREKLWQSLRK